MLFLNLPFAIRPGLTGSSVNKNVKQCKLGLAKVAMLDGRDTIASLAMTILFALRFNLQGCAFWSHIESKWAVIGMV